MGANVGRMLEHPAKKEELDRLFRHYDKDKDGKVDAQELQAFVIDAFKYFAKSHPDEKLGEFIGIKKDSDLMSSYSGGEMRGLTGTDMHVKTVFDDPKNRIFRHVIEFIAALVLHAVDSDHDGVIQLSEWEAFDWTALLHKIPETLEGLLCEAARKQEQLVGRWHVTGKNGWGCTVIGEPDEWRFSFECEMRFFRDEGAGRVLLEGSNLVQKSIYTPKDKGPHPTKSEMNFCLFPSTIKPGEFPMHVFVDWKYNTEDPFGAYHDLHVFEGELKQESENVWTFEGTHVSTDAETARLYSRGPFKWRLARLLP